MFREFLRNIGGNIALSTAIFAVPLFGSVGVAIDYSRLYRAETVLQDAADAAALASAKELSLSNSQNDTVKEVAKSYVLSNLSKELNIQRGKNSIEIEPVIAKDNKSLTINLSYFWEPFLLQYFGANVLPIKVTTTANLAGRGKICMIALEQEKENAIHLTKRASLEAPDCGIYSNSTNSIAIRVQNDASITSGVTCSAGGIRGLRRASFTPDPIVDCPQVEDPLANRKSPEVGVCDYKRFVVNSGTHTLDPGTYCKGLRIQKTAKVFLNPGIYVINGGKLQVTDDAILEGKDVGFYLSGDEAKLTFRKQTTINLTAPTDGIMAGLLIFEDRTASTIEEHQITSDNARKLLGTIYLPNGTLRIDSEAPIADQSAYTAIIARSIKLREGPTLYLNSDYEATNVPVPDGLDSSSTVYLSK